MLNKEVRLITTTLFPILSVGFSGDSEFQVIRVKINGRSVDNFSLLVVFVDDVSVLDLNSSSSSSLASKSGLVKKVLILWAIPLGSSVVIGLGSGL